MLFNRPAHMCPIYTFMLGDSHSNEKEQGSFWLHSHTSDKYHTHMCREGYITNKSSLYMFKDNYVSHDIFTM